MDHETFARLNQPRAACATIPEACERYGGRMDEAGRYLLTEMYYNLHGRPSGPQVGHPFARVEIIPPRRRPKAALVAEALDVFAPAPAYNAVEREAFLACLWSVAEGFYDPRTGAEGSALHLVC